jgi:HEAT repeat protein
MRVAITLVFLAALTTAGASGQPDPHQLLADPNPQVRLRAALALADRHEVEAFPVLIDLITELDPAQRQQAEERLQQLAGEWAPNPGLTGDDEIARRIRKDAWAAWWRNTDGPALVAAFRKRTMSPEETDQIQALIANLGDKVYSARERAGLELVALGTKVVPLLRLAAKSKNLEQAVRAQNCLKLILKNEDKNKLPAAAVRLLALRKPPQAVEVLLAYLPFADDEGMQDEMANALKALAVEGGKVDAALVKALEDPLAMRRAYAAEALAAVDNVAIQTAVRKLLKDPEALVRLRAAMALTLARFREAVPVLIDLVCDPSGEQVWQAEDLLGRLAGDKAPLLKGGANASARKKYREEWEAWWKDQGAALDLAKLADTPALLGFTLITEVNNNGIGRVIEVDRTGKIRWQIDNIAYPVDAYLLSGKNHVLVVECNGARVSERDLKGTVLWQHNLNTPVNAQRFTNGHTFIAGAAGQVLELDAAGKNVFTFQVAGGVRAAYKTKQGQIYCLSNQNDVLVLDTAGKQIKRLPLVRMHNWTSGIDVTPKGHILVAQGNNNSIVELDQDGKVVWTGKAPQNTSATRLINGNTLVASYNQGNVIEIDSASRTVWEYKAPAGFHPFRARRR